jgi:hypothetical protein
VHTGIGFLDHVGVVCSTFRQLHFPVDPSQTRSSQRSRHPVA